MTGDDPAAGDRPTLVVPPEIRDEIVERARAGRSREVCGVLAGTFDADRSRVSAQYPTANAADRPRTRYRIDPEEQLATFERLESRGETVVGFYHSHPRGPRGPSATDAALATWPNRSYLIVSLAPLEIGSWRWRSDGSGPTGSDGTEPWDSEEEPPPTYDGSNCADATETDGDDAPKPGRFVRERLVVE